MTVETRREEFSGREVMVRGETAVTAAAAQAKAAVEARYIVAMNRPRDMAAVREKLLRECGRKGFADAAFYSLPRGGKKIRDLTVRFAEAAMRAVGNIHVDISLTYEDAEKRLGTVAVTDLESNATISDSFSVDKFLERLSVPKGATVLGERVGAEGQILFKIAASETELLQKQNSVVARVRRNLILQLLPGDIRDEAKEACERTIRDGDAKDPRQAAKRLCDALGSVGVSAAQVSAYLGHAAESVTPDEAADLRGLYLALKDGQTTWADVMEAKTASDGPSPEERAERAALLKTIGTARMKDKTAVEAARKAAGVAKGVQDAALPVETLKAIVAGLTPKTDAPPDRKLGGGDDDGEAEAAADLMGGAS